LAEFSHWEALPRGWMEGRRQETEYHSSFLLPPAASLTAATSPPWLYVLLDGPLPLGNPGLGSCWHCLLLSLKATVSQSQDYWPSGARQFFVTWAVLCITECLAASLAFIY